MTRTREENAQDLQHEEENPNENCLEGMKCPECGSFGPFTIGYETQGIFTDDGEDEQTGDHEWDDNSYCACTDCEHSGTVWDYTEAKHGKEKPPTLQAQLLAALEELVAERDNDFHDDTEGMNMARAAILKATGGN